MQNTFCLKKYLGKEPFLLKIVLFIFYFLCTLTITALEKFPQKGGQTLVWSNNGISILLNDFLNLPAMSWPQTLLEYPIDFAPEPQNLKDLILVDQVSSQSIPFQLTEIKLVTGKIQTAVLCFLSDLPSGEHKAFRLTLKKNFPELITRIPLNEVSIVTNENQCLIGNGLVRFKMPKPGEYNNMIPPILQIGNDTQWLGYSNMPASSSFIKLKVSELSAGTLLANYMLDYQYRGGKSFLLKIRLVAGMEFIETEEKITGFSEADSLEWKIFWTDLKPEYRYCPNRPGAPSDKNKKGYTNFAWEPISGSDGNPSAVKHPELPYDQKNLSVGLLPFKIAPYHNWMTWWCLPSAAFWNEKPGQTIGLFISDFDKWADPDYPIWGSKDNLSVHFYYKEGFYWSLPLVSGTRSLALAIYPHNKDIEVVNHLNLPQIHIDYLRRWYGWISLNKTKDWVLDYKSAVPNHKPFFKSHAQEAKFNPLDLLPNLKNTVVRMAESGERSIGPNPVGTRTFYDYVTPLFENAESTLTENDYRQARAWYLFMTYVFMDETLMPMRNMLSGHPNFLADIKGVPGMAAFLFPDHPKASEMVDHFEKAIALNLRYHTRPEEPAWESKGGRWTENLGCYTWAFLRPTLKTSFMLHHFYDGKNRMLQPNISLYTEWLLNGLTSPLESENGRRVNPPQGAHSKGLSPSNLMYTLGQELFYYDPILAEHLFWVTSPDDKGFEFKVGRPDPWDGPAKALFKHPGGTNPHLKSEKYTGYGFNLRKNFGMSDELYVHLQQIDDGPNYRWGRAAKGGNGIIYYYATGKRYSHNGMEDVGDAPFGDTERCTNFGVKKEKSYRCIGDYRSVGRNDLTEPLYDFGFAQFASIRANKEAAPEYNLRSVLMSGNDYILIFDDVKDNSVEGRLSWFVGKEDSFPFIYQLKPGIIGTEANIQPSVSTYHKDEGELTTKGRYYDGKGDFLTLVTHKDGIKPVLESGICQVGKPDGTIEKVFSTDKTLVYTNEGQIFEGYAGIIRQLSDKKSFEAALFNGNKIGIPGIVAQFLVVPEYGGMSIKNTVTGYSGIIQLRGKATIMFSLNAALKGLIFYLDGIEVSLKQVSEYNYSLQVEAGKHIWQWTNAGIIPTPPVVKSSVSGVSWCEINWSAVPGASSYSIQKSTNGGINWNTVIENIQSAHYKLTDLADGKKLHIRIKAIGKGGTSEPSNDYPVYPSSAKPHAPEGLIAIKTGNHVTLNWGQVLGADQYKLYQREKGTSDFKTIYSGTNRFASVNQDISPKIFEFSVTATNGNGESPKSFIADTDENRIINWYPVPGEIFRRDTESQENGYDEYNHWIEQKMPVLQYPFQIEK